MRDRIRIAGVAYGGRDLEVSEGLLSFVEDEEMWSLRIIAAEPLDAASLAHGSTMTATTPDGEVIMLGHGSCLLQTENSRYHFAGRDPKAGDEVSTG